MRYKKIMILTIILTCLLVVSAVCAADNATNDVVSIEETTDEIKSVSASDVNDKVVASENQNDEVIEIENQNKEKIADINNDINICSNEIDNSVGEIKENDVLSSNELNEVLGASPSYNQYSVRVSDRTLTYGTEGSIFMSITPYTDGWSADYKYDFYLKVYDSNGNEKISKRYYSTTIEYGQSYNVGATSLNTGVYSIKIINYKDKATMCTAKLTVLSVPQSVYSVRVYDTTLTYGSSGYIDMSITPASTSYYYKYDFYLKVYDSNGNEKISQRYYSTSLEYSKSYSVGAKKLDTGVYTIKILNNIDNSVMSTAKLTVLSVPSYAYSVNVYDTTINYGSKGNLEMFINPASDNFYYKYDFYLKVYDSRGYEKISQRYYSANSDYTKTYTVSSSSLAIGVYTIKILNNIDNSVISTAKLSIKKTDLQTQDVTGNCNEIIEFKVRAGENNNYKSGLNVTIVCNNKKYHVFTNDDGYASLKIHLKANTYNVRTIFQDTVAENTVIINPVYVTNLYKGVYVKSFTGYYNGKNKINYGWKGNLEGYFKIFKGNKLIYKTKFNSNGKIYDYFTYATHAKQYVGGAIKNIGTYKGVITDVYGNVLAKNTIKIKKASPKLSIPKKTFNVKLKTKKVKITLKDNSGVIKKAKLTLKVKGKTYKAKTNSKGVAIFKVKKLTKKGTYSILVKFKGNKNYNKVSKKFKISVKKIKKTSNKKKTSKKKSTPINNKKSSETYKFSVPHADADVKVKVYTGNNYNIYTTQTNWLGNGEVYVTEKVGVEHKVILEVHYYDNGFKTATYEGQSFFLR